MPEDIPPAPTERRLEDAALAHLARFAATEAGLRRVLEGRVRRWALRATRGGMATEAAEAAAAEGKAAAARIARRLVAAGVVDDTAFAEARARRLLRGGRSARTTLAHLAQRGVAAETARAALTAEDAPDERRAALAYCRRRRLGPFAPAPPDEGPADPEARRRSLAALARAGFPRDAAEAALAMPREEAEARLLGA